MAFLQFLSGSRDQEVEELHPTHSTYVGSGGEVQITLKDPNVLPQHCQLYPDPSGNGRYWLKALPQGSTILKMRRLGTAGIPDTVQLDPGEVFILGPTYVKFWAEQPPSGGGGGGADPAQLQAAQAELAQAQAELERLRAGQGRVGELEGELSAAQEEAQRAREELKAARDASEQALAAAHEEAEAARAETAQARQDAEQAAAAAQEAAQEAAEEAAQERARLVGEVAAAKQEAEAAADEAERVVTEARAEAAREREEVEASLEATRAAFEAVRGEVEARGQDRLAAARAPSDLDAILETLRLPDAVLRRVRQALQAEVDRELLRRSAGPVVPLRGLSVGDRDLEAELRAVRRHATQVACARELSLAGLGEDELERLLAMARG
ncbi:MAG: FHA domain-containing protein [Planctomycetota bacterium]